MMADLPDPGLALVAQHTGGGYIELRPNQDLGAAFAGVRHAPIAATTKIAAKNLRIPCLRYGTRARKAQI